MNAIDPLAVAAYPSPTRVQMRRDLVTTPAGSLPPGVPAIDYTAKRLNVGVDVAVHADGFLSFVTAAEVTATYITAAQANATFLKLTGGTLTGPLVLAGDGAAALQAVTVQQLNAGLSSLNGSFTAALANYLPLAGGTLTGALTLQADAAAALQPVSLQQMNASFAALPAHFVTSIVDTASIDLTVAAGALSAAVKANSVTDALLRQGAARSVVGNPGAALANVADILSTVDGQVLQRIAGALGFTQPAFIDGTQAAPGIPFISEPGLGMRRVSAGVLATVASNVELLRLAAAGLSTNGGVDNFKYETGTFTPIVVADGGGAAVYTTQVGTYLKLGQFILLFISLNISSHTLVGTNVRVQQLPFTPVNTPNQFGQAMCARSGISLDTNYTELTGFLNPNQASLFFFECSSTGVAGQTIGVPRFASSFQAQMIALYRTP